ncbi:MAG TPA: AlkA N-terminal domain-containing protein [Thermoleophilia bacterium]|nr:AlkA N-terminal domain-containing protein [Thermoleophilia bacterium]
MIPDFDICYQAMQSRDPRFDGWFYVAVSSTRIYCRPSCPAMTPQRRHVSFYPTAAAAQGAGYRACLRCRPDASPGSPEWNLRANAAGRAMRLIADGVVDREGVDGLARRLAYSPRQLRRLLQAELGAGPLGLARAQRAHTARLLIETTGLPFAEVAFAAGFASLRQFNDTVRAVFALTPTEMRRRAHARARIRMPSRRRSSIASAEYLAHFEHSVPGLTSVRLRLPYRTPLDADGLLAFFAQRAIPGVEEVSGGTYRRTLRLPGGIGIVELTPVPEQIASAGRAGAKPPGAGRAARTYIAASVYLTDLRDLGAAVGRCRALLDLDADPQAVDAVLRADPLLAPLVRRAPGKRVPGAAGGFEIAVRAVLGQQVSVASARGTASRIVWALGEPLAQSFGSLTHVFPTAEALRNADDPLLPVPASRRETIRELARRVADGELDLDAGTDREDSRRRLLEIPGVGPWTTDYIAMRVLADTDAFPATDLGVLRGLAALITREAGTGVPGGSLPMPAQAAVAPAFAERWRPWRAYAVMHLWAGAGSR